MHKRQPFAITGVDRRFGTLYSRRSFPSRGPGQFLWFGSRRLGLLFRGRRDGELFGR